MGPVTNGSVYSRAVNMADMFLMLDGIKGESIDALYRDHIEIHGWEWHIENNASISLTPGDAVKHTSFRSIKLDKLYDVSSVTLMNFCALGKHIPKGTLACRKNIGSRNVDNQSGEVAKMEYLILELKNIKVDKIEWPGRCEPQIVAESVTLTFNEFAMTYQLQNERGDPVGAVEFGFNVSSHTEVQR
jgi:type VI secretion system secreted protein Hcp